MANEELYQPTTIVEKNRADVDQSAVMGTPVQLAAASATNAKQFTEIKIKPSLPNQNYNKQKFNQTIKDIEAAVAEGNVSKVVFLSKELYNSDALISDSFGFKNGNEVQAEASNILFIEKSKQLAEQKYKEINNEDYIPKNKEEIVFTDKDLGMIFETNQEGELLKKDLGKYKKLKDDGWKKLTTTGYDIIQLGTTGKYVTSQEDYDLWSKGEEPSKTYTQSETIDLQKKVFEATGVIPEQYKKKNTIQNVDGKITVNGIQFATMEEAQAEVDYQNILVDAYAKNNFDEVKSMLPADATKDIDAKLTAEEQAAKENARLSITQYAANMDVSLNETDLNSWIDGIAKGTKSAPEVQSIIKEKAKIKYGGWSEQFEKGLTVTDIADGYIQAMSKTLELDPTTINLQDPTIQKALTVVDDKGQVTYKPLWQFERELKSDERYYKTNKSHNEMASLAAAIAKDFGMI